MKTFAELKAMAVERLNNFTITTKRNHIMNASKRIGAAVLNLFYGLFQIMVEIFIWMTIPLIAIYFASYFVPVLGTGTYSEIATIVLYIIAAIAGIRGAIEATAMIRSFRVKF